MVIKTVELETVCGVTSVIPDTPFAEVAFAGRSNVGKSSLINALMNRKALAHISSKPGKTQTINFYNINNCMYLVDLPGYGYATANVEVKAQWGRMIENYLHVSKQLAAVFLLIDIRHDPTDNDQMMYQWIKSQGYKPIIIATKMDKITKSKLKAHLDAIHKVLEPDGELTILPFSSLTKEGREKIWAIIDELIGYEGDDKKNESNGKKSGVAAGSSDKNAAGDAESTGSMSQVDDEESTSQADSAGSVSHTNTAGSTSQSHNSGSVSHSNDASPARKPRWKSTGKPVAKKTQKMREKRSEKKHSKT